MKLDHGNSIEWPNGLGFTVCTDEYANTIKEKDAMRKAYGNIPLREWHSSDHLQYDQLKDKLERLEATGHLGGSIRY